MAERAGFEPAVHLCGHTHDFQSCSFGRSDISPQKKLYSYQYKEHYKFINHSSPLGSGHDNHKLYFGGERGIRTPVGALWPPNRFRVDPVTTTSVPLRILIKLPKRSGCYSLFAKKSTHNFSALFPQNSFGYFYLMIQPLISQNIIQ